MKENLKLVHTPVHRNLLFEIFKIFVSKLHISKPTLSGKAFGTVPRISGT